MPDQSWRKSPSVVELLLDEPQRFPLVQAIRVIERAVAFANDNDKQLIGDAGNSAGRYSQPIYECVRFNNSHALSFPGSEIANIIAPGMAKKGALTGSHDRTSAAQWQVLTSFMGITGAHGVMPYNFTETILQRLKFKDPSLAAFLDLFNHRIISLFYQASVKYKLTLGYERKRLPSRGNFSHANDTATHALRAITGLANNNLDAQLSLPAESLLFYSGLLSQQVRTATGLKQILSSYFNVPVDLKEFVGRWQDVIDDIRSRLPDAKTPKGQNVCLGRSAMLGKRGWVAQGKVQIVIGPLSADQFRRFAPGSSALKALNDLTRFYLGFDNDYDFTILVDRKNTPERVELSGKEKPIVGWNTWLSGGLGSHSKAGETMSISLSSDNI